MGNSFSTDGTNAETTNLYTRTIPAKRSNKILSSDISEYLDDLGFSRLHIWMRIHDMNINSKLNDLSIRFSINTNNERVYVGSQREGLGMAILSDQDVLQIDHNIICTQGTLPCVKEDKIILKIIDSRTSPGYCLLQVGQSALDTPMFNKYEYAAVQRRGHTYLSSKLFVTRIDDDKIKVNEYIKINTEYYPQNGPSTPKCIRFPSVFLKMLSRFFAPEFTMTFNQQSDFVKALPCVGHTALTTWRERTRKYNWPSEKTIRYIMNLPVYVVPVGQTGSVHEEIEWRISFVLAEIKLVQSFNNLQSKIFVLLKLIAKHYLRLESKVISTYVIKNVMLWMAEEIPQKKFRQKHLMARMMDALQRLKEAVLTKSLPSYMQPKRNLFASKFDDKQQRLVAHRINTIESEGLKILCDILYNEQPSLNVSRCANTIMEELSIYETLTRCLTLKHARYDLLNHFKHFMIEEKVNYVEELLINNIDFGTFIVPFQIMSSTVNYKYYSDRLIETDEDLRKRSIEDLKPGRLDCMDLAITVFLIRLLALVPRAIVVIFNVIYSISVTLRNICLLICCKAVTLTHYKIIRLTILCMWSLMYVFSILDEELRDWFI